MVLEDSDDVEMIVAEIEVSVSTLKACIQMFALIVSSGYVGLCYLLDSSFWGRSYCTGVSADWTITLDLAGNSFCGSSHKMDQSFICGL